MIVKLDDGTTIYDISRTVAPNTAVWPGDTPFSFQMTLEKRQGYSVNLTTLNLSAHTGSHADAPFHYMDEGAHPAELPLENYIGPARVVSVTRQHGGIVPADFAGPDLTGITGTKRLLIHTWYSDLADSEWNDDFPYPTVELVNWLADQGAILLGVDMPSVDKIDSKTLDAHHQLYKRGMLNLELLNLKNVPDGTYELIALPLKIAHVCGSPVRAILRTIKT